jgi:hypothetical protein
MTESEKKRISIIGGLGFIPDILGTLIEKGGSTKSEIKDLIKESICFKQKCFISKLGIMRCYGPKNIKTRCPRADERGSKIIERLGSHGISWDNLAVVKQDYRGRNGLLVRSTTSNNYVLLDDYGYSIVLLY